MQILPATSFIKSLSSSYLTGDNNVSFLKHNLNNIEGFNFNCEEYLLSAADSSINNYSSLYLTSNNVLNSFLNINNSIESLSSSFTTSLLLYAVNGIIPTTQILTVDNQNNIILPTPLFTSPSNNLTVINNTYFNVELLSPTTSRVIHKSQNTNYYLTNNNTVFEFLSSNDPNNNIFNYILDTDANLISFFIGTSAIALNSQNKLSLVVNTPGTFQQFNGSNCFKINYYLSNLSPKINTDWVSYNTCDVSLVDVNNDKSYSNLTNNYLVNTQYSNVTGNNINVNFLQLKNQFSHSNYNYKANNLNVDAPNNLRKYTGLFTGNNEELGKPSIELNYEFYNADYKFICDKYTVFITPQSLYPYVQLNINDTQWSQNGSIGGKTPYYSDKVFYRKVSDLSFKDGQYLCTWLSAESETDAGVWMDRYYYPSETSFSEAIAGGYTFNSVDPIETLINNNATLAADLTVVPFFDKTSDLLLLPNEEYIYQRIGNNYVKDVIDTLKEFYVANGLSLLDAENAEITIDGDVDDVYYNFDNNTYSLITDYSSINNPSQFTLSFSVECDDWTKPVGHQLVGNLNDKGIALLDDRQITPLLYIQNQKYIYIYNSDFNLIDTVTLTQSDFSNITETVTAGRTTFTYTTAFQIQSIHRTDHLDFATAVIRKVQYNCAFTGAVKTTTETVRNLSECPMITTDDSGPIPAPYEDYTPISTELDQILIYEPCNIEPSLTFCSCLTVNLSTTLPPSVKFDSYPSATTTLIVPATGSSIYDANYNWNPWVDTNVDIYVNHTLTIAATGTTQSIGGGAGAVPGPGYGWSHGTTLGGLYPYYGPYGFESPPTKIDGFGWDPFYFNLSEITNTYKSVNGATGLLSGKALGRLIGKIDNGYPFEVTSNYTSNATVSGRLYLAMNDNNIPTRTFSEYITTNLPTKSTIYANSANYIKYGITVPAEWENDTNPITTAGEWNTYGSITDSPYSNHLGFLNVEIITNRPNWIKFNTNNNNLTGCPYYAESENSTQKIIYNSEVCNWTLICSSDGNFAQNTTLYSRTPDGIYYCGSGSAPTTVTSVDNCYSCSYNRTDLSAIGHAFITSTTFTIPSTAYPYADDSNTLTWDFRQDTSSTATNKCPVFTYLPAYDPIELNYERLVYTPNICGWTLYVNFESADHNNTSTSPAPTLTAVLPNSKDPWGVYTFINGLTALVSKP